MPDPAEGGRGEDSAVGRADIAKAFAAAWLLRLMNGFIVLVRMILFPFPRPREVRNIVVYRVGTVGDIICALPALKMIRDNYPSANITLLTSPVRKNLPGAKELIADKGIVDEICVYYRSDLKSLRLLARFFMDLRRRKIDVWIEFPRALTNFRMVIRNLLASKLAGAKWSRGHRVSEIRIFPRSQAKLGRFTREAEQQKAHLRRIGLKDGGEWYGFVIPEEERSAARRLLEEKGLDGSLLLAVNPGAKRPANRWMPERFAEVSARWSALGGKAVIIGGIYDAELGELVGRLAGEGAVNLCGMTSLWQSAEIISRCKALLTNDTGTMHLGAAVGVPCVVPFSARDFPRKWYPIGERHAILRRDPSCSPCFRDKCPFDNRCLRDITVDEVWDEVRKLHG